MITFKELKRNLKKEVPDYPIVRIALVGDTATQFLATAIKGMGIERGYQVDLFEDFCEACDQLLCGFATIRKLIAKLS